MAMKREILNTVLYDSDIREPLFDYLEERFGKNRIFEEKIIGKCRADIIMLLEGQIVGLEIKSDADTYERLKRQVRDYDKYCDMNYIVSGKSHEKRVEEHIPSHWGVLVVERQNTDGGVVICEKRPANQNPKMKKERQITLLWRPELQHILDRNHLPKYKQRSKRFVQLKILEKLDWDLLKAQMCEELFERDYTLWDEEMEEYRASQR